MRRTAMFVGAVFVLASQSALAGEVDDLKAQLRELREEVEQLRDQVNKATQTSPPPPRERGDSRLPSGGDDVSSDGDAHHNAAMFGAGSVDIPKLSLRGFLDVGFNARMSTTRKNTAFTIGQIDFLATSRLSERIQVLIEMYFSNPETGQSTFIPTRANIQYGVSNALNLRFGQVHVALGYWNHVYHHGSYLQPSYSRPEIYRYDRAYLPIHAFGAELFGTREFAAVDIDYTVGVFNGRGRTPPAVQRATDENDAKAVSLLLSVKPHGLEGLAVGAGLYHDKIPPHPDVVTRTRPIAERIVGGHLAYRAYPVELVAELLQVYHDDETSQAVYHTRGGYVHAGYTVASLTPYYRLDVIDFGEGDPFYASNTIDATLHTLGVRWDFAAWNALKLEYSLVNNKRVADDHLVTVNLSFTF